MEITFPFLLPVSFQLPLAFPLNPSFQAAELGDRERPMWVYAGALIIVIVILLVLRQAGASCVIEVQV
ncbi:hypothetical protein [Nonomuraea roseoviolacea]|uniref:Uncharacterized protein n=1 Tax=Nonomuraea roseoviolacea subsp. carminata TaxID=160689 RepID=A0ABT1JV45_9ACTN|nr:hypothetical protein [Nonomuraea roseoviolacea]MCP2345141.1 hypothetical protein [Nonomuraea roseoviolacea subsp. carminata]